MKLVLSSVFCLSLVLFHTHFSLAKKGGVGGRFGKGFGLGSKKFSWNPTRGNTHTNTNTGQKKNTHGTNSKSGYPKQPTQNNPGGHPPQPGAGGYQNRYPVHGSPYGGHGAHGGYGGGYINQNPNNKILSPHYGGSFGYGGYDGRGGSPFSHSVQAMGISPNEKSKGFGRNAAMAAAGGAVAGMALGYGLGRFPRPHYHFHNPQEEHYYNHYMYRKYGVRSSDNNDYSRDYTYSQPPQSYDNYMDACMKRKDLLPPENQKPKNKPPPPPPPPPATTIATVVTSAPAKSNDTATENSAASNQPEAHPVPPASQAVAVDNNNNDNDDDDTVSISEISYPALIDQMKARRCLELYMVYSEDYFERQTGGAEGLEMSLRGFLAAITSIVLMLLNSNMLTLLH